MLSGAFDSRSSAMSCQQSVHSHQSTGLAMIKVNVRLVNKDLYLPDFPCMPAELVSKFVDKMCLQFSLNKESVKFLTSGNVIQYNLPGFT